MKHTLALTWLLACVLLASSCVSVTPTAKVPTATPSKPGGTPTSTSASTAQPVSQIIPNDPGYAQQWGPAKVNAPRAWANSSGSGVTIAIVDSGVDLKHPDLAGKVVPGYHYYTDANGNRYSDKDAQDGNGHGTHVAGIAAAIGNNHIGVAGIAWSAQIMPVKVMDSSGAGYVSDIADGITWAVDNGAKIINLSLGSPQQSDTLTAATDYAYSHGSLVLAAAGNCGDSSYIYNGCQTQNPVFYPAANPHVLGIGATDSTDRIASFSDSGSFVYVSAPGVQIYSTYWTAGTGSTYMSDSGTSMAAPMVSGLAALIWSRNPTLTNAQVANAIAQTAADLGGSGYDQQYGYGRIDAGAALVANTADLSAALQPAEATASETPAIDDPHRHVRPGAVLVRLRPADRGAGTEEQTFKRYGVQATSEVPALGVKIVSVPVGEERQKATALQADPTVEFAEPDYRISLIK